MLPPNILITNFCNQQCSFCFARKEMASPLIKKEVSMKDFKTILRKVGKKNNTSIKLMGGEPTLHSKFKKIISLALKHYPSVRIFTNGIFSKYNTIFLIRYGSRVKFTFNLMTPGFLFNKKVRDIVFSRIRNLVSRSEITISLTIDPITDIKYILKLMSKDIVKLVNVYRIGLANPLANNHNCYTFKDFSKTGKQLCDLVSGIRNKNPSSKIVLNCGFTRCMLTNNQYMYLKESQVKFLGWSCFGKNSSMDITTDLTAFHCFPLSLLYRLAVDKQSIPKTNGKLLLKRYEYWITNRLSVCEKCSYYGYEIGNCPGPCIAFIMNSASCFGKTP